MNKNTFETPLSFEIHFLFDATIQQNKDQNTYINILQTYFMKLAKNINTFLHYDSSYHHNIWSYCSL